MAPKKAGKKKDEVVDLPKASSLPDGAKSYFVGGWSASERLSDISAITELVRPRKEEDEASAKPVTIFVLAGKTGAQGSNELVTLSHNMVLSGISEKASAANAVAYESSQSKGAAAPAAEEDASGAGGEGATGGEGAAAGDDDVGARPIVPDLSVEVLSEVTLMGVRPTVTVAPAVVEVKAAAPAKGKKQSEEEKQRIEEERRQREEAALRAAKEEEDRLNKFAMPRRWANVKVENITFSGKVSVRQAHVTFTNCVFLNAAVDVNQYCKVQFLSCVFAEPKTHALYCYPQADVVVKKCVFSGVLAAPSADRTAVTEPSADARNNIGVHTDSAKLVVEQCTFTQLGTGVLLRGRYEAPAPASSSTAPSGAAAANASGSPKKSRANTQVVSRCSFRSLYVAGLWCDHASDVSIQKNQVLACGHYGLRITNGGKPSVIGNAFTSIVFVAKGSRPVLHSNKMDVPLMDENEGTSVYMEPSY